MSFSSLPRIGSRLRQYLRGVCLIAGATGATAGPPQLGVENTGPATIRLTASGLTGTNANLQTSFDLENWMHVQSAAVAGGTATFDLTREEPVSSQFFRAVEAPPPVEYRVVPQPDLLQSAAGLITPEAGGEIVLKDRNGITYELRAGSNLVWEPVLVTMTVIPNFTGMPLSERFRAAVLLEPDGLEFRGAAEVRIRFPSAIPELEMVGYGFEDDGSDFHLKPWRPSANEVVLPVAHFSGVGVAAEPFPPTGNFTQRFEQAWRSTRDAALQADQHAAELTREASRVHSEGQATLEEFNQALDYIRAVRNSREFHQGIEPLLEAAATDCAVGEVVVERLDRLEGRSGLPYGQGPFFQEFLKIYPKIRCNCAHYYIERCERDPTASGMAMTRELTDLIQQLQLMTGLTDAQSCDLGSDAEILDRLRRAACQKEWEGVVRYQREEKEFWTTTYSEGFIDVGTVKNLRRLMQYTGRVTAVLEEDGGTDPDFNWEFWRLRLMGKMTVSLDDNTVRMTTTPRWREAETTERQGRFNQEVKGDLALRFEDGQPETVLASVGLEDVTYQMPRKFSTETVIECLVPECPDSVPRTTRADGHDNIYFAFGSIPRDVKELQWENGMLKVVFERVDRTNFQPPLDGYEERIERATVQLWRRGR